MEVSEEIIIVQSRPELKSPILIAGFEGWGNALDISKSMVNYLTGKLQAKEFAALNGDQFFRYDENRPWVDIEGGILQSIIPPGGKFYYAKIQDSPNDLVIIRATEPHIQWYKFARSILSFCKELGVRTIITLGSMYDNVLHTDLLISGVASDGILLEQLKEQKIIPVDYQGPSAIHSVFHSLGQEMGFRCISLWCHCPYYLQGTTHFGLLSELGSVLSSIGEFNLDTEELQQSWKELNRQIQELINKNHEVQDMIEELRKAKVRFSWASVKESIKKGDKVIHLEDFLRHNK